MTAFFNFRAEVLYKYDQEVYDIIMESFDALPLSCLVNGKFLALHGGISPNLKTVIASLRSFLYRLKTLTKSTAFNKLQEVEYFAIYSGLIQLTATQARVLLLFRQIKWEVVHISMGMIINFFKYLFCLHVNQLRSQAINEFL